MLMAIIGFGLLLGLLYSQQEKISAIGTPSNSPNQLEQIKELEFHEPFRYSVDSTHEPLVPIPPVLKTHSTLCDLTKPPSYLIIMGSTGSVGMQTLDLVRVCPKQFPILGLAIHQKIDLLLPQIEEFCPKYVTITKLEVLEEFQRLLTNSVVASKCPSLPTLLPGHDGLSKIVQVEKDLSNVIVISAIVGTDAIASTVKAIEAERKVVLANKESLIAAGDLIISLLQKHKKAVIIPADSEHSALYQCLQTSCANPKQVKRLILTCSGGPFLNVPLESMKEATTLANSLNHPKWTMGEKITVDSAALINKGLEVIEAAVLFGFSYDAIDVVIHPESIIHSMIELYDGAVIAHMSAPDMRFPLAYALNYPNRVEMELPKLDFAKVRSLNFQDVDNERFPALQLAYKAGRYRKHATNVYVSSAEIANQLFRQGAVSFAQISQIIEHVLDKYISIDEEYQNHEVFTIHSHTSNLESILAVSSWAKRRFLSPDI